MALEVDKICIATVAPGQNQPSPGVLYGNLFPVYADGSYGQATLFSFSLEGYYYTYPGGWWGPAQSYWVYSNPLFGAAAYLPGTETIAIQQGSAKTLASNGILTRRPGQDSWYSQISKYILTPSGRTFFTLFEFDGTQSFYYLRELTATGDMRVVKLSGPLNSNGGTGVVADGKLWVRVEPPNVATPFASVDLATGAVVNGLASVSQPVGLYENEFFPVSAAPNIPWEVRFAGLPTSGGTNTSFVRVSKNKRNFWVNYVGTSER